MKQVKVYTVSKLDHADMWKKIKQSPQWSHVHFTARWPFFVGQVSNTDNLQCKMFWDDDLADISRSDVVLVYAEPEDKLCGALVEAGMGIALGKTVIVIGDHSDYSSWQFHSLVKRVNSLEKAMGLLQTIANNL